MEWYALIKMLHILGSVVLFGTGAGIAFFMFQARHERDYAVKLYAAQTTVKADYLFTLPAVIIQPLSGAWLIYHGGYDPLGFWLVTTYSLYIIAGVCWVPVVVIQITLKKMLIEAVANKAPLPERYHKLFRLWFLLGWPAFLGLIIVFFLMVAKPS